MVEWWSAFGSNGCVESLDCGGLHLQFKGVEETGTVRVDEHKELVEYVKEERQMQQQRQRKENAPAWTRAKYWLLGFPDGE